MSRILWLGNPPWVPSGYGEQAGLFIPRMQAVGHELAVMCNYGLHRAKLEWNGLTCYPSDGAWGNEWLPTFADHHRADQVIALCDAWVLKPDQWPTGLGAAVWAPIDHYPIPPLVLAVLGHGRIRPIAMSRFGERLMREAELEPLYVPHGVDTTVFRPQPDLREQVRDELGIPADVFLAGMVAANVGNPSIPRKSFPQAFHAFGLFAREHDDAWLYVHTETKGAAARGGIDLDTLAAAVGCPPGRVRFPNDEAFQLGMTNRVVAALYQAFDVLLMPSMGEGFGIPLLEAQACGVPVIASDHSAMSELTQAGWLVAGDPWYDALQSSFFIVPSIASVHRALEAAYAARDDQALRAGAVEFAQLYDADVVFEQFWQPALAELAGWRPSSNGAGPNRAARRRKEREQATRRARAEAST